MPETVHRANLDAVGVFAADAGIGDDKGHGLAVSVLVEIDRDSLTNAVFAQKTAAITYAFLLS
ncbi:hypothetical protein [Collimonas sp.]|uniref:hypothetical protein n=1 Tax=Collimonas sp. TaxID=1963772 RepID=UPI002C3C05FB|nr:hypothetical protein [Collimonas sp.]HWW04284.1 hypothetical protein [Collimonas sp.]